VVSESARRHARSVSMPALAERAETFIHRQLDRRLSRLGVWIMRTTKGSLADRYRVNALVLTTTGRRSGRPRAVVLQYFPDGDAIVVVATNDGGRGRPAWLLNLEANNTATVEIRGRHCRVTAHEIEGVEAERWWKRILEVAPDYARYSRGAARSFPVVRLTRAPSGTEHEPRSTGLRGT